MILDDGTGGTTNANGHAPAPYADAFKFDLAGNRVEEDITGSQTATVKYTYSDDNQLLTETRTGDGAYQILYGHYDANNVFRPGYDADGNLLEQHRTGANPEDDSYTWDLRGRMSSATVNGQTTGYTYDTNEQKRGHKPFQPIFDPVCCSALPASPDSRLAASRTT